MNRAGRHPIGARPLAGFTVHETRAAVMTVDLALRDAWLAGPADASHVMGSLGLMTRTLQQTMTELASWLREQEHRRQFSVVEGPFLDHPESATDVAAQSLMQASQACREVYDALERAHIAMAHVGARSPAKLQGVEGFLGARRSARRSRRRS
jgi:hypothetical protein